jgi:hypothetical protein
MKLSKIISKVNVVDEFINKFGIDSKKYKNLQVIDNKIISIDTDDIDIIKHLKLIGLN